MACALLQMIFWRLGWTSLCLQVYSQALKLRNHSVSVFHFVQWCPRSHARVFCERLVSRNFAIKICNCFGRQHRALAISCRRHTRRMKLRSNDCLTFLSNCLVENSTIVSTPISAFLSFQLFSKTVTGSSRSSHSVLNAKDSVF